jgi:hypothetical protein
MRWVLEEICRDGAEQVYLKGTFAGYLDGTESDNAADHQMERFPAGARAAREAPLSPESKALSDEQEHDRARVVEKSLTSCEARDYLVEWRLWKREWYAMRLHLLKRELFWTEEGARKIGQYGECLHLRTRKLWWRTQAARMFSNLKSDSANGALLCLPQVMNRLQVCKCNLMRRL